ncbi:MAG: hypothetical protein HGB12_00035 [Bacteroidetes bacterium]|nr:hypothetical protein [Bacteroidota bacterium]
MNLAKRPPMADHSLSRTRFGKHFIKISNNVSKTKSRFALCLRHRRMPYAFFIALCFFSTFHCFSQGVSINTTGNEADNSAALDISSTTQGALIPRMTMAQRNQLIGSDGIAGHAPATGCLIYQTDNTPGYYYYNGSAWAQAIGPQGATGTTGANGETGTNGTTGATGATGPLIAGTSGQTLRNDGSSWVANSLLYNNGTNVGIGTTSPASSAALEVSSTTQGALMPRMTTAQRSAIASPVAGLMVFNIDCNNFNYFDGVNWVPLNTNNGAIPGITGSITGSTSVCANATGINYSITPITGATSYIWTYPLGTVITSGTGTNNIIVTLGNTTGNVCVSAYNECGTGVANCTTVTVNNAPAALVASAGSEATTTQITTNWNVSSGATHYHLDVSTNSSFANFVTGYNNKDVSTVTTYNVAGIICGTTYYYRVRAENTCGTSGNSNTITYSTLACFVCGTTLTDSRDSKTYNTVLIGSQCWMAQNINYSTSGTYINSASEQTNNGSVEKYCYGNDVNNCNTYGGLYQWAEMVQYINGATNTATWSPIPTGNIQGICPTGWHIPKDAEFCIMENAIESGIDCNFEGFHGVTVGNKMKTSGTWSSPSAGTNTSGFSALPGGNRNPNGTTNSYLTNGYWATASEYSDATYIWFRMLGSGSAEVNRWMNFKTGGLSVRCVNDN